MNNFDNNSSDPESAGHPQEYEISFFQDGDGKHIDDNRAFPMYLVDGDEQMEAGYDQFLFPTLCELTTAELLETSRPLFGLVTAIRSEDFIPDPGKGDFIGLLPLIPIKIEELYDPGYVPTPEEELEGRLTFVLPEEIGCPKCGAAMNEDTSASFFGDELVTFLDCPVCEKTFTLFNEGIVNAGALHYDKSFNDDV